jgi:hypothetical protein
MKTLVSGVSLTIAGRSGFHWPSLKPHAKMTLWLRSNWQPRKIVESLFDLADTHGRRGVSGIIQS